MHAPSHAPTEIKALIFDWGNVLELVDQRGFDAHVAALYGVPLERYSAAERVARLRLDAGDIATDEYFSSIERELRLTIDRAAHRDLFFATYVRLNAPLLDYIRTLKPQYLIVLLSNTNPFFREHMNDIPGFAALFDKMLLSYQQRLRKPDPRFFALALEGTALTPQECLFIDDRADLVLAARALGMHAIVYTTFEKLLADLAPYNLKTGLKAA